MKPFSEACERNQSAIAQVLASYFSPTGCSVIELGSGTGQHGVYFARTFRHVEWQCTDLPEVLPGIETWCHEAALDNLPLPKEIDVNTVPEEGLAQYDYVFSANTLHFVSASIAGNFFKWAQALLAPDGCFLVYGPFMFGAEYSSEGDRRLDQWLKQRDPLSGIKSLEWVKRVAGDFGFQLHTIHEMPANNKILVFGLSVWEND